MFDLVTVGHFAIDTIISPRIATPKPTLGGPPTYVSVSARRLGARVSVISKVGDDFSDRHITWLTAKGVDLSGLKRIDGASTTRFVLTYMNRERRLQMTSCAPPIRSEDVPDSLRARAIHVAPIVNEVSRSVVDKLRRLTGTLSLDPQGFVRELGAMGNLRPRRWSNLHVLEQIDLYKSSASEIRMITGFFDLRLAMEKIHNYGAKVVIVTRGNKGSKLLFEGKLHEVPACKSRIIRDSTGAGDAFIGAFLAEYVEGKEPLWCARVGSAAASFVVEGLGPRIFGEKKEIYSRATGI